MPTITHDYTYADGSPLTGTVRFTHYTEGTDLRPHPAGAQTVQLADGQLSATLDSGIYAVSESLKLRSETTYVVVVDGAADLHELPRFDSVAAAHTATSAGEQGPQGPEGPQGPAGEGVPAGGAAGDHLTKTSATDYDTEWTTPA